MVRATVVRSNKEVNSYSTWLFVTRDYAHVTTRLRDELIVCMTMTMRRLYSSTPRRRAFLSKKST